MPTLADRDGDSVCISRKGTRLRKNVQKWDRAVNSPEGISDRIEALLGASIISMSAARRILALELSPHNSVPRITLGLHCCHTRQKTCFTTLLGYQIRRRGNCPLQPGVFANVKVASSYLFGPVICRCHRFGPDRATQPTSDPASRKIRRSACPFPVVRTRGLAGNALAGRPVHQSSG